MDMNKIFRVIQNPQLIIAYIIKIDWISSLIPDRQYLKWCYFLRMGKKLDINNPKTFSEKMQWLKLYERKPIYTVMVDKFEVKKYVSNIVGEKYIIPTIGIYDSYNEIDFGKLPNQFVLKCTHDSGGAILCTNKETFNYNLARKKLERALRRNYYYRSREWPYKDVKPRIIVEEFMKDVNSKSMDLIDYKFFCFNGVPKYCQVIQNRRQKETIDFFDMDWNHQEFVGLNYANCTANCAIVPPTKPHNFDEMKILAEKLSRNIPFVRIDTYEIQNQVYFGEITFFPAGGLGLFKPDIWNKKMGDLIDIPV